jgi:hypothetical protein
MFKIQRNVCDKLGKNNTYYHEKIYNFIENKIGKTKSCNFGNKNGSKTGVKHEGARNIPIRNFPLKGCSIDENGEVIIVNGDGLQGFCRDCDSKRRRKRLEMSREKNKEGYDAYEREYGKHTKICSVCKEDKDIRESFKLSLGMECGLHNVCNTCSKKYGESMGDRLIKYRPDGNFTYKKTDIDQHDDHIMPLAYGGTNSEVNHQLLTKAENLKKSSTIPFENVHDIPEMLLCERWRTILHTAKAENISIIEFKSRISFAIMEEQRNLSMMNDEELENVFKSYNSANNKRINTQRAVRKFRIYCKNILNI